MIIDVDGNGNHFEMEDDKANQLKHEHHVAMINLSIQTTLAEINNRENKKLVARFEKKVNGNNGNACSHETIEGSWFTRLFRKRSKETLKS